MLIKIAESSKSYHILDHTYQTKQKADIRVRIASQWRSICVVAIWLPGCTVMQVLHSPVFAERF